MSKYNLGGQQSGMNATMTMTPCNSIQPSVVDKTRLACSSHSLSESLFVLLLCSMYCAVCYLTFVSVNVCVCLCSLYAHFFLSHPFPSYQQANTVHLICVAQWARKWTLVSARERKYVNNDTLIKIKILFAYTGEAFMCTNSRHIIPIDERNHETEHHSQAFWLICLWSDVLWPVCVNCVHTYAWLRYTGVLTIFTRHNTNQYLHVQGTEKSNGKWERKMQNINFYYVNAVRRSFVRAYVCVTQPDCNLILRTWFSPYFLLLVSERLSAADLQLGLVFVGCRKSVYQRHRMVIFFLLLSHVLDSPRFSLVLVGSHNRIG